MKEAKYIFAVDSDGCAMDTMTYKHEKFFGPLAADAFEVEEHDVFQKNWEDINLYSRTRGVNRYTGLVMGLQSINYDKINIDNLVAWEKNTDSLSNDSLEAEIADKGSEDLQRALDWSKAVNKGVSEAEGLDKAFDGALEGLAKLAELGQVDVVSSANRQAIDEEWERHGLLAHVDGVYAQDAGKKADVLAGFIADGTPKENIMMVGDSPGDLEAAEKNGTFFYPILVGKEKESWDRLREEVGPQFVAGNYTQADQDKYVDEFWSNLDK